MALEICYWTGADPYTRQCLDHIISSETMTLTGTSSQSGTIPDNAEIARLHAGENCRFTKGSANPTVTATNGQYLAAGESVEVRVTGGYKIAAMTA